jgi:N-acetylglucosaminyl-diphospho-decaprenol L-rhamnosyltransferase
MINKTQHRDNNRFPLLTISIVSHGDTPKILRLLESIHRLEQADSIQIIVTDNLGHDFPEIDHSPWSSLITLRNESAVGFACNHNRAFRMAEGKYFCVLNPDVVFEQAIMDHLVRQLEIFQTDIIAPLIVDSNEVIQDSFRALPTPLEVVLRRFPSYRFDSSIVGSSELIRPDWLSGIFLLMRSETYRGLGGMNEKYRLYFEDVEFCTRARLAGLKLAVDTRVRIQHDAQRASHRKLIYLLWHVQSAIRFFHSSIYKKAVEISR